MNSSACHPSFNFLFKNYFLFNKFNFNCYLLLPAVKGCVTHHGRVFRRDTAGPNPEPFLKRHRQQRHSASSKHHVDRLVPHVCLRRPHHVGRSHATIYRRVGARARYLRAHASQIRTFAFLFCLFLRNTVLFLRTFTYMQILLQPLFVSCRIMCLFNSTFLHHNHIQSKSTNQPINEPTNQPTN